MLLVVATVMLQSSAGLAQKENEDSCGDTIYTGKEVSRKAKITKITEPLYTDEARAKRVQGTVILTAVFCSNGKVTDIQVVEGLPHGLTERAIETTRLIQFEPAAKDGQAVSQHFRREVTFRLF